MSTSSEELVAFRAQLQKLAKEGYLSFSTEGCSMWMPATGTITIDGDNKPHLHMTVEKYVNQYDQMYGGGH